MTSHAFHVLTFYPCPVCGAKPGENCAGPTQVEAGGFHDARSAEMARDPEPLLRGAADRMQRMGRPDWRERVEALRMLYAELRESHDKEDGQRAARAFEAAIRDS